MFLTWQEGELELSFLCSIESVMEAIKVILTSESVNEILWSDHSTDSFSAELSYSTIYILVFYKKKFGIHRKC